MAYYSSKLWGKKKTWNMEAFIAPANFDAASQPLNIVTVFGDYNNVNKAYIFSFTSAIATLTLSASSGVTYRWGETIDGVDYVYDVVSGTAFTAGSTKRYVIVNSTATSLIANISSKAGYNGAVWIYCSSKCYQVFSQSNTYLKYIHCEDLNSITTIGQNAFYNCTGLTGTLTIPNSVTTIGGSAFRNCTGFTGTLTIPNSVTTIETSAFSSCTGFTGTLTIPNSVTTIGSYAFNECNFSHILSNSISFEVYDEVLYTTTGSITAIYSAKGYSGTLTLKSNVVVIMNNCFYKNNLRTGTLTIPNSVTTIGENAFYNCTGFTGSLTIPNSVTTIGGSAFRNCTGFTGALTISNSVTTIYGYAFEGCTKLSGIGTINGSPAIRDCVFHFCRLISEWHIISPVAPAVQLNTWANYAKPLHVKIGATGYNVSPWTDTTIFSSIIYDL